MKLSKWLFLSILLLLTIPMAAQGNSVGWKESFINPTNQYRPTPFWHLNGKLSSAGIEKQMDAANLLDSGHASQANYLAFQELGDPKYKQKAIYWMRSLLAFTYFWEPENVNNLYSTKPVLSSSDWYFANWVRDHVQWEVLSVFSTLSQRNISWTDIDPEIDWLKFQTGITNAAIQWMNIHTDKNWFPHNLPESYEAYQRGDFDYAFPDTHNSVTGNYGGMMIPPGPIAENIYFILDRTKVIRND